jgi:hypothetical protein
MPSRTRGKVSTRVAGTAGISSLGISVFAMFRWMPARAVPDGMAAVLVAASGAAALACLLKLVLEYRLRKLEVEMQSRELEAVAELKKIRLETHRIFLEKAVGNPGRMQSYCDLLLSNAMYLSVEQNGANLTGQVHGYSDYRAARSPWSMACQAVGSLEHPPSYTADPLGRPL